MFTLSKSNCFTLCLSKNCKRTGNIKISGQYNLHCFDFFYLDMNLLSPGVHAGHFAPYNACMSAPKRFTRAYEQAYYCIARAAQKKLK